ncbi:LysR family transcriptional regulator [Acinetobacter sp. MD2]|uniref:LysR family transcriptional regulator n=1 Tax=Acinetobacter sp. MD2 TaxID=2600066 RepID=UPI002D1E5EB3|nr:LysR family transcriptional regulator [Acinetobacter sp. MD2]MEB3766494.1 LysR family transcriptional regulator [Acinetobacter sp. MD2]
MLNRISLRQMEYFVATAESGSIIIASEKIHVSSPSISAAIAHIESELQVQLFIRQHAKGLILTNVGEQVMKECQQILAQAGSLYALAANFSGSVRGPLKLGCFTAFAPMLYAEIIHGFSNLYKSVDLELCEGDQEVLINGLQRNVLDVVLTYDLNIDDNFIHFEPLASLPPYALFSEEHPLAQAPAVTLEELSEQPMILLDMPYSNDYFISLFKKNNLNPKIVKTSKNSEVIRAMVANNIGYSILNVRPKINTSLDGKRLVRVRISGEQRPMQIGLATAKNAVQNIVTQAFISRCRAFISDQYIPGMAAPHFYDPYKRTEEAPHD